MSNIITRTSLHLSSNKRSRWVLVAGLLAFGVFARFLVAKRGFNFDFDSWMLVGDIAQSGGNVYAETQRYNYGPVWFTLLGIFKHIAEWFSDPAFGFRFLIVGFLTLIDVGIWAILKKYFGYVVAFVFFLNPISIVITGYHNQFENLAIFLAMAAVMLYGKPSKKLGRRKIGALVLLGISLMTKHIFFVFPLWLAVKQVGLKNKLITLTVPIGLFLLSFLPFYQEGKEGIIQNVFKYQSVDNAPFWNLFLPDLLQGLITTQVLFIGTLVLFAFVARKHTVITSLLLYSLVLVVFAPAIAQQYLVIVVPALAVFLNGFSILYFVYATLFVLITASGLQILEIKNALPEFLIRPIDNGVFSYYPFTVLLAGCLFWIVWQKRIMRAFRSIVLWFRKEIAHQITSIKG